MKKILSLTALCALSVPVLAVNQEAMYGSVGAGVYRVQSDGFDETAATMKILGGYNFSDRVALEGSYTRLFENSGIVDDVDIDVDGSLWEISTKLSLPLGNRFSPYGRLGWSYVDLSALATDDGESIRVNFYDNAFVWAIGTGVNLTKRMSVNGEYSRSMIDEGDLDFLSVSLTYGFGNK